jgi:Cytochrome oxidase complex assembly protein 1
MRMYQIKLLLVVTLLVLFISDASLFVLPPTRHRPTQPLLSQQQHDVSPKKQNFLARIADKVTSWLPFRPKVEVVGKDDIIERSLPTLRRDLPVRSFSMDVLTDSVARTIKRDLTVEKRKAKPLLHQAVQCIRADKDLREILGEPIKIGPIFGRSSSTTTINGRKRVWIEDDFEVVGSRNSGAAKLTADKYSRGHVHSLRVNVQGIAYDVDLVK